MLFILNFILFAIQIFRLIYQSLNISDELYSCNWQGKPIDKVSLELSQMFDETLPRYDFPSDVNFMKNIKFAISRSQKPLVLMAMKFSALALPTFSRVSFHQIVLIKKNIDFEFIS